MAELPGFVMYNGIPISTETPLGAEVKKFEDRMRGYRPENHPYPMMLFRARKCPDGVIRVFESIPEFSRVFIDEAQYQRVKADSVAFNNGAVKQVENEEEHRKALENGWSNSQEEAIALQWKHEHAMQEEAARTAFQTRKMSDKAQAEAAAYAASTPEVVAEVPEARKRGRPRKEAAEA